MTTSPSSSDTYRTLFAAAVIALLVLVVQSQDALRDFTRPVVIATLHAVGISAADKGEMIAVGRLMVPWTRDCAGVNLLLILMALAVWVNRHEKVWTRFWLRIALMVPAALMANVARVLALIAWRATIYPAVESPQTHYFMGLVWLVPFVTLITPKTGRPLTHSMMETLHAAAVVALLAPMSGTPNGWLITIAAVVALTHCRVYPGHGQERGWLTVAWLACGGGIALINMDSFWLPWLLLCPPLLNLEWARSLTGILVIAFTHSLLAMQPWAMVAGSVVVFLALLPGLRDSMPSASDKDAHVVPLVFGLRRFRLACILAFALPFTASTFLAVGHVAWVPPSGARSRTVEGDGFEVALPGQSPDIGLVCYDAPGRDRHHTVKVCLKYRGVELEAVSGSPDVFTDGDHWLREFFLQDGALLPDYMSYLRSTFKPWASPGVHVIFVAPKTRLTPASFDEQCILLAGRLQALCLEPPANASSPVALTP